MTNNPLNTGMLEALQRLSTEDGWSNLETGIGIAGCDKGVATFFGNRRRLSVREIDQLYGFDGMSAKVVDDIVDDGFRCGWQLKFQEDGDESVDPEKVADIRRRVEAWHKSSRMVTSAKELFKWGDAYGGALLILGADDGGDEREPLDPTKLKSFDWMRTVDRFQVSSVSMLDTDPRSRNYGKPIEYRMSTIVSGLGGHRSSFTHERQQAEAEQDANFTLNNLIIHNSRAYRVDGEELTYRARWQNGGWGQSKIERAYDPLKAWGIIMKATESLIHDYSQGVYGIKGLADILSTADCDLLKRFRTIDRTRSIVNAILIDSDGESFERKTTNVAGLPDLIAKVQEWLSAVTGSPLTKLFGLSPGGFGTGEAEGENWDDKVKAWQDDELRPFLEFIYRLLFATPEFSDVPDGWTIEFNPLQLESPEKTAEVRSKNAQTDALYIDRGVVTPQEVAMSRFGGPKYGDDIELNMEARGKVEDISGAFASNEELSEAERLNAAAINQGIEPPGEEPSTSGTEKVQDEAMNGGQIGSLQSFFGNLKDGVPLESVVQMAMVAFPTLSQEQATAMFRPYADKLEKEEAEKPEPPTMPPGVPGATFPRGTPAPTTPTDGDGGDEGEGDGEDGSRT